MIEFFQALFHHAFLQNALWVGWLASVACGVVGSYVVVRRISYLAGGIAHCALGGLGFARYMQVVHGWSAFTPMLGALLAALLAAVVIGWINLYARERMDTAISALWGMGMATGVLFISRTPGYATDLMSYLFGNMLLASPSDLLFIGLLDLFLLAMVLLFGKQFTAVCFDEEFARLQGIRTTLFYFLLLAMVALSVVLLISVVGIVMVIVLLTIPAALAGRFTHRLGTMMFFATLLCALFSTLGLAFSYAPGLPPGATIILLAGLSYLSVLLLQRNRS